MISPCGDITIWGAGTRPEFFWRFFERDGHNKAQPQSGRARHVGGKTIKVAIIA